MESERREVDSKRKLKAERTLHGTLNPAWLNAKERMKPKTP